MAAPLYEFMNVDRSYDLAKQTYMPEIPEDFNFAYDVIDRQPSDATAIVSVSPKGDDIGYVTYGQLAERSARFANGLSSLAVGAESRAIIVSRRIPEWHVAIFGCMKAGVVSVNILKTECW